MSSDRGAVAVGTSRRVALRRASLRRLAVRRLAGVSLAVVSSSLVAACSTTAELPTTAECAAVVIEPDRGDGTEARATASAGASVWALFFTTTPMDFGGPAHVAVGDEVKIVWRATGTGPFVVVAQGPDGQRLDPDWGPELHTGSNWIRPGEEWGTGWTIPDQGCWTFSVIRDDVRARLGVDADAAPDGA
ncbi:MAG: hypothetical protein ABIO83_09435 [Ilumatobacteraceae bacterium]